MRGEGKEESYIVFCFLVLSSVVRKEFHVCSFFFFLFSSLLPLLFGPRREIEGCEFWEEGLWNRVFVYALYLRFP